ncbi:hypothetical protein HGRIS_007461 [Hohenbuehelia grisea]|uniref:Acyl-protein thioesterase 1 n=1 Tax=Hohenbuehelia grisea TaxID=104357 RepID=A0ABR3J4W1_9AGAR
MSLGFFHKRLYSHSMFHLYSSAYCLHSPQRELTLSPGHRRPSWFDLSRLPPPPDDFDEQAMSESSSCIENIILGQVHAGIDSRRIVLIGFSQGAALSLVVALTTLYELAGAVIMSGWLPHRSREHMLHTAPNLPILWCHGTADDEIPIACAEEAAGFLLNTLRLHPRQVSLRQYPGMKHSICDAELEDILRWLESVIAEY